MTSSKRLAGAVLAGLLLLPGLSACSSHRTPAPPTVTTTPLSSKYDQGHVVRVNGRDFMLPNAAQMVMGETNEKNVVFTWKLPNGGQDKVRLGTAPASDMKGSFDDSVTQLKANLEQQGATDVVASKLPPAEAGGLNAYKLTFTLQGKKNLSVVMENQKHDVAMLLSIMGERDSASEVEAHDFYAVLYKNMAAMMKA